MSVRKWNAGGDELRVPTVAGSILGVDFSVATTVYLNALPSYALFMSGRDAANGEEWSFGVESDGRLLFYTEVGGQLQHTAAGVLSTSTHYVVACTKSGNTLLFHYKPFGGAWTHVAGDLGGGLSTPDTTSFIAFGENLDGQVGTAGLWASAVTSPTQVEALDANLRTADWTGHAVAPQGVWDFNQAVRTDAVPDLMGNHASISGTITGGTDTNGITLTTIVTGTEPPSWVFGAGGGGGSTDPAKPPVIPMRPAVIRANGWW